MNCKAVLTVLLFGLTASVGVRADTAAGDSAPAAGAQHCSDLAGQSLGGAVISAATLDTTAGAGQRCVVSGTIHKSLHFRVELPATWNRRLLYYGGGGWDGAIMPMRLSPSSALAGYVIVASDGGHTASGIDAAWALDNPQGQMDFAFLSVHTVFDAAKAIVHDYYRNDAQHSYFEGCSNGGREALIEAARFPADFDGIIARSPAYNWTALFGAFIHNAQRQLGAPGWAVTPESARIVEQAALAQCDGLDGLKDGIISNRNACHVNLEAVRCAAGAHDGCLTDAQIQTVKTFYSPLRSANGSVIYPGWGPGGEQLGWGAWIIGAAPGGGPNAAPLGAPAIRGGAQMAFADGFVKFWLMADPNFDLMHFDPARNAPALALAGTLLDASPDLSTFFALGHKLILWHGTADWAISYRGSIGYFNDVAAAVGGERRRDESMEFFLAPGVEHCGGGAGADGVDLLTPLSGWVEQGRRPSADGLVARKSDEKGRVLLSRPLCRYPGYPKYKGRGDATAASSFTCATH